MHDLTIACVFVGMLLLPAVLTLFSSLRDNLSSN